MFSSLKTAYCTNPVREKIEKICKVSAEKLFFPTNAVNATKLCMFTVRVSGDLTKTHHNLPLK